MSIANFNTDLNEEELEKMGFTFVQEGEGDAATWIIFPDNLAEGESLPLAIYQGGDGHSRRLFGNFFNVYDDEVVQGESLSRGVYVCSPKHGLETLDDNAYQTVNTWMEEHNVNPSIIGVSPFSGGGDVGMVMAVQAAEDYKDIPVISVLMDAANGSGDGHIKGTSADFITWLNEQADTNKLDNLYIYGGNSDEFNYVRGFLKEMSGIGKFSQRMYQIIKNDKYVSHSEVKEDFLSNNVLLSLMGLSSKLSDAIEDGKFKIMMFDPNYEGKFDDIKGIDINDLLTKILNSDVITNDEQVVNMAMDNFTLCTNRLSSYLQIGGSDPTGVIAFANSKLSVINSLTDDFAQKAREQAAATRTYSKALTQTGDDIANQI